MLRLLRRTSSSTLLFGLLKAKEVDIISIIWSSAAVVSMNGKRMPTAGDSSLGMDDDDWGMGGWGMGDGGSGERTRKSTNTPIKSLLEHEFLKVNAVCEVVRKCVRVYVCMSGEGWGGVAGPLFCFVFLHILGKVLLNG